VLHDAEVTYAAIVPQRALGGPRGAYLAINRVLAAGLRALGADVSVVEPSADVVPLPPDAGPCFQSPVVGELVARGRKLVGSAQARIGGALLQHGSIILSGDQRALRRLEPAATPVTPPATLEELIGPVEFDVVVDAVAGAAAEMLGGSWERSGWSPTEAGTVARLRAERYDLEEWTFRR
jgi:lipoate-protein ligase A